jgi:hypothetical protein
LANFVKEQLVSILDFANDMISLQLSNKSNHTMQMEELNHIPIKLYLQNR